MEIKDGQTVIDTFTMPVTADGFTTRTLDFVANQTNFGIASEGPHPLSVESTDTAGNVSAQSQELLADGGHDGAGDPDRAGAAGFERHGSFGRHHVDQPAGLPGTVEPNALVRIYADGLLVGQGVATSAGDYEITVEPLTDGVHVITAQAEDVAGNLSVVAAGPTITVDTLAPQRPTHGPAERRMTRGCRTWTT